MDVLAAQRSAIATTESVASTRFRFFWRVHFWAAVITAPIVLFAALTGLLYVFTPQIEAWRHATVDNVVPEVAKQSLDTQLQAAREINPSLSIRSIIPAYLQTDTTQVIFGEVKAAKKTMATAPNVVGADEHSGHENKAKHPTETSASAPPAMAGHGFPDGKIVYINPYTAIVVGTHNEMDRFNNWARKLHSTALQGDGWRWVLELGASWLLVMLCTGIYLWWPRQRALAGQPFSVRSNILPRTWPFRKATDTVVYHARFAWRDWHSFIGLIASGMLLIVLITGLTWSKYTGDNFRAALKAVGQAAPRAPSNLKSTPIATKALGAAEIAAYASAAAPKVRLQLTPPRDAQDVWRVANFDRSQPTARVQMMLDQYSGKVLFQAGWDDLPLGAKATGAGIPFHRGEFGWWNQALLVFAALAVVFSVISGFVMWWKRRPQKAIAAPKIAWRHLRAVPWWLWLLAVAFGIAMPIFGLSLIVFASLELVCLRLNKVQI